MIIRFCPFMVNFIILVFRINNGGTGPKKWKKPMKQTMDGRPWFSGNRKNSGRYSNGIWEHSLQEPERFEEHSFRRPLAFKDIWRQTGQTPNQV